MSGSGNTVDVLSMTAAGIAFQNPVLLASGTADYGESLDHVMHLDALGGLVTKAVSIESRPGNPSPRVAEFDGGMINAVGLANPGVDAVMRDRLPWLATHLQRARVLVNVVGRSVDDFAQVVASMEDVGSDQNGASSNRVISAYELNVSCPNVKAGGLEFGADPTALTALVSAARRATQRPIFVKLSPTLTNVGETARVAVDAGANGISVINTIPGLVIDVETRATRISFGSGGVSGPGLLPVGVLATWKVRKAVDVPIIGIGGIASAEDALQYLIAGASLVAVGTAAMRDPGTPERIIRDLRRWCGAHGVTRLADIVGTLQWPSSPS